MSSSLLQNHPFLGQYFSGELEILQTSLIQGLLSSIALYLDKYNLGLNVSVRSNNLTNLVRSFLVLTPGSYSSYPEITKSPVFRSLSNEISQNITSLKQNQAVYKSKVLVTLANMFGVVFKEISENNIKTFGPNSNSLIVIWLYTSSTSSFILFPANLVNIDENSFIFSQQTMKKIRYCGHNFSHHNNSWKCQKCQKPAYKLEFPGKNSTKTVHPCQYCDKAKLFRCKFCNENFCSDHQPSPSCILCNKSKKLEGIQLINGQSDVRQNNEHKKSSRDSKSGEKNKNRSKEKTNDFRNLGSNKNESFADFHQKLLSHAFVFITKEDSIECYLKLVLSSDFVSDIINSQQNSNDPLLLSLNKSLKTLKKSTRLKSESQKSIISLLDSSINYLEKNPILKQSTNLVHFLSFAYTFNSQVIITNKTSISKFGFQGNFRAFVVLINPKEKLKIKTIHLDKGTTETNFRKDDNRMKKIGEKIMKKKRHSLRLCCGCIFDTTEIVSLNFQELLEKFNSKCEKHQLIPNKLEFSQFFKFLPDFNQGCIACNFKNSEIEKCTSCNLNHCLDICQEYSNLIKTRKVNQEFCAFCLKKLNKAIKLEELKCLVPEIGKVHLNPDQDIIAPEILSSEGYMNNSMKNFEGNEVCVRCKVFPMDTDGLCKVCITMNKKKR